MDNILQILQKCKTVGFDKMSDADKSSLLKAMARRDHIGAQLRQAFAAVQGEMLLPILDQQSYIRKIFRPVNTNGEQVGFPVRSKKIRAAWYGTANSNVPQRQTGSELVYLNYFPIEGGVRWTLKQLRAGNIRLIENHQNDMMNEVLYKETLAGFELIQAAYDSGNGDIKDIARLTTTNSSISSNAEGKYLSVAVLNEMAVVGDVGDYTGEDGGQDIQQIFLSARRFADIRKWADTSIQSLGDNTRDAIFNRGKNVGSTLWGMEFQKVREPEFVDDTKAWGFTTDFGVMGISEPWNTFDDPTAINTREQGITGQEEIGFAITNVHGAVVYNFQ